MKTPRRAIHALLSGAAALGLCGGLAPSVSAQAYASRDPEFPVRFTYSADWALEESQGRLEPYRQVRLRGSRNAENTYTAYVTIRRTPLRAQGGRYEALDDAVAAQTAQLPEGAVIELQATRQIGGLRAEELIIAYTIPPMHRAGLRAVAIPVRTRTILLQEGTSLYELVFSADAREYASQAAVLDQVLEHLELTP